MSKEQFRVKLTGSNIRNHHSSLRDCMTLFPEDGVGGKNKAALGIPFRVTFEPGPSVETDVVGDKLILRNRATVRTFFEASAAREGDSVVLEQVGDRAFAIRLDK